MKPPLTVPFVFFLLLCSLLSQAQYHSSAKPTLAAKNNVVVDVRCQGCYMVTNNAHYDSVLIGCWFWPHDAPGSITFNKDGTFSEGDCPPVGYPKPDGTHVAGTYSLKGRGGWLIFKDGHRQHFYLVLERFGANEKYADPAHPNKTVDWKYVLALQNANSTWVNYLE